MKRIIIEYDEKQPSEEQSLDLFSWLRNELDNAGYSTTIMESTIEADGSSIVSKGDSQ